MPYNKPALFIWIGLLFALLSGAAFPTFGVFFSKIVTVLTAPTGFYPVEHIKEESHKWCAWIAALAGLGFVASFINKYMFALLGENITKDIRVALYTAILKKNIGWYDHSENSPGVLTACMAEESGLLNGVCTESMATMCEALFAVTAGIGVGFYFSWKVALVCVCCVPLMGIGTALGAKFQKQQRE